MSKHTPGPWVIWEDHAAIYAGPVKENLPHTISGYRKEICECDPDGALDGFSDEDDIAEQEEVIANARLIASSPDLLEALESLLGAEWMVSHDWGGDRSLVIKQAQAAIAKAKGEA